MTQVFSFLMFFCLVGCGSSDQTDAPEASTQETKHTVVLTSLESTGKIQAIKVVRQVTGLGLADAKRLVEGLPATLKSGVTESEAASVVEVLRGAGLAVEVHSE